MCYGKSVLQLFFVFQIFYFRNTFAYGNIIPKTPKTVKDNFGIFDNYRGARRNGLNGSIEWHWLLHP